MSAEEFKRDWEVVLITDRFGFRPARVPSFGVLVVVLTLAPPELCSHSAEAEGITKRVWEHFTERQEYLRERGIAIDRRGLALGDYIWVARKRQHPYGMPSVRMAPPGSVPPGPLPHWLVCV